MSEINNITELLNSQESEEAIDALFKKHENDFFTKKDVRVKFGSNLKSAILLDYFKNTEEVSKRAMIRKMMDASIFEEYYKKVIFFMNAYCSRVGDRIGSFVNEQSTDLYSYKSDKYYKDIKDKEDVIIKIVKRESGILKFSEILSGDYVKSKNFDGYLLTEDEISKISFVKMIPTITNYIHEKYDDQYDGRIYLPYGDIKEEALRKLAFRTSNYNASYKILFDDDVIILYENGEFRFLHYGFNEIVELIELCVLKYHAVGIENEEKDETLKEYCGGIDYTEIPLWEMDPETFELMVIYAFEEITGSLCKCSYKFTQRMINEAKEEIGKYKRLSLRFRL